jgi:predicted ArsR family transcriptional regulator
VPTQPTRAFLASTRGQIVALLRGAARTVEELAGALDVTDNAVRAHLATLERDGLVEAAGRRRGVSKPSIAYDLTREGEQLFPEGYEPVLGALVAALGDRFGPEVAAETLRDAGRRLAAGRGVEGDLRTRVDAAAALLGQLGGAVVVEDGDGHVYLRSRGGPLAGSVAHQPQVCLVAEALVGEIVGEPARACCEVGDRPRCCFEIPRPDHAT